MAIIKCIKCGEEFNDKDNVCPNCACLIKCSLKKDNNKINDEESQDKKYDVTINIVHSIRTNMLLKMFIKRNKFKENVSLFGKDESGFNRYYSKGKYFNYKIENNKLIINAYETFNYCIPIENGCAYYSKTILPNKDYKDDIEKLVKKLRNLN